MRSPAPATPELTSWKTISGVVLGFALCVILVWNGILFPSPLSLPSLKAELNGLAGKGEAGALHPIFELLKLIVAALLGSIVTIVHRRRSRTKPFGSSLEQAQILLAVSGAMMMLIIGDSLPRAFGIAGAASIIRFRTPMKDPKDTILLFLLLGLGMSCGLGYFGIAALATLFLCLVLLLLEKFGEREQRAMLLEVVAGGPEFPRAHVQGVLSTAALGFEPREVARGEAAAVRYHVLLDPRISVEQLTDQLMNGGNSGVRSVTWDCAKGNG